jgi:hypothetical protein
VSSLHAAPAEPVTRGRTTREWLTIALLLVGGVAVILGWFLGLGLLWTSLRWTQREKWIGTLVIPGGLFGSLWVIAGLAVLDKRTCSIATGQCTSPGAAAHAIVTSAPSLPSWAPIATAIFLARRAKAVQSPSQAR